MKLSAIALGLAAAGAFAQAPAAAPAAEPAKAAEVAQADSVKAAEEAKAAELKKAEEEKAAAEAKKAEEEKAAAEAKKAEEEKKAAEAKKAEEEKAAAEAKKAEEEKKAAEAKKAEEEKKAAEAKKAEEAPAENTNPGEVAQAASSAFAALKASMNESTSAAQMEVKFSGSVELDAYTNDLFKDDADVEHNYYTDVQLNVDVKFNDRWSAFLGLEGESYSEGAGIGYSEAYLMYKPLDIFFVKVGDLSFAEGGFQAYYGYDDTADAAAGMKDHDIRGIQIGLAGLELGFGFARNDNDIRITPGDDANYNLHLAYEFNYMGQHLRPYVDYKSYQEYEHNELHAGIDAGLNIGGFSFRAVYGFHSDFLGADDDIDLTSTAHTILVEPSFDISIFQIKTTFFYAFTSDDDLGRNELGQDVPEYMFAYAEPAFKFGGFIKIGIPVEFHTNTLDDDADISTLDVGARVYVSPVENLEIMATGMFDIPVGDNNDDDDTAFRMGVEATFNF